MQGGRYPEVPDDFGHWLAGWIDGEGSFMLYRMDERRGYATRFTIKLRRDDKPLLEEARARTGLGAVYDRVGSEAPGGHIAKPQASWNVETKPDTGQLVRLLDRFPLRSKKARDYAVWRQVVLYRATFRPVGRRPQDWGPVPQLYEALRSLREYPAENGCDDGAPPPSSDFASELTLFPDARNADVSD